MADYYLAQWSYPTYAAIPTGASWPLDAQDGDGLASGVAVSAAASVDFTGCTASANSFIIMGVTLSVTGANAPALATAVVAAIQASIGQVAVGVTASQAQLRDMCYARVDPGNSSAIQIMTRPGSATLNYATNTAVAITTAGLWNAPPAGTNSTATIWPSAKAINTYGVAFVAAAARPLVGPVLTFDDTVNAKGGGVVSSGLGVAFTDYAIYIAAQLRLLVDDGAIWTNATGAFTFLDELSTGRSYSLVSACATVAPYKQVTLSAKTPEKLIINLGGTPGAFSFGISNVAGGGICVQNALFIETTTSATAKFLLASSNGGNSFVFRFVGCRFLFTRNLFTQIGVGFYTTATLCEFLDCVFEWTALAITPSALFTFNLNTALVIRLTNLTAIGCSPTIIAPTTYANSYDIVAKNLKGFDLGNTLVGLMGANSGNLAEYGYCLLQNVGSNRAMRLETNTAVLDWNPAGNYPTLNSTLPNGTPWSYRLLLSASENATRYGANVELLSLTKTFENTADAVATLKLELAVITTYAASITTGHLALLIAYTDTSNITRLEKANWSASPRSETTALTASAATWTLNDYGSHVAKKIEHTTAYAVKVNTEIEVSLMLRRVMPAQVEIFVDPDIVVTV